MGTTGNRTGPVSTILMLWCAQATLAATVVNSSWRYGDTRYSNPANWSPAEVPNNSAQKSYNVTAPVFLPLDMSATVSNLNLNAGLQSSGYSFYVTGTTTINPIQGSAMPDLRLTGYDAAISFVAGALSTFSSGVLRGSYELSGPATLQFTGANIKTLRNANLVLNGAGSRLLDENGTDALRNLARIEADSFLTLNNHLFSAAGDVTVDGSLNIGAGLFAIAGSLTNFDAAGRTLRNGSYSLSGDPITSGTLQFRGADILNNAANIYLSIGGRIVDEAGRDGLRNFAHNLPSGLFTVYLGEFVIAGNFTNDGLLTAEAGSITVAGSLTNYDPAAKRLSGGTYQLTTSRFEGFAPAKFTFTGADIARNAASILLVAGSEITDENGKDALRSLTQNEATGALQLNNATVRVASDFANAGTISLYESTFTVPEGHVYRQTAGKTALLGAKLTGNVEVEGGELSGDDVSFSIHDAGGVATISGNVTVGAAVLSPQKLAIHGAVQLSNASRFHDRVFESAGLSVDSTLTLGGTLQVEMPNRFPVPSDTILTIAHSAGLSGGFSNAPNGGRVETLDGFGSFAVTYSAGKDVILSGYQRNVPAAQLLNVSTRAQVLNGGDAAIGGFIIYGREAKKVIIRAIGPSLSSAGVSGALQDPTLELHESTGQIITTNNNWQDSQGAEISATHLAPTDARESAILTTLEPGAYTAVMRGANNTTGVALVEVYDLNKDAQSKLANISTRGFLDPSNLLIGGVIVGGDGQGKAELVVRAIGFGLQFDGVEDYLADPALDVRDGNGALVASNDDFATPPENDATIPDELHVSYSVDAATAVNLPPGKYTVVVYGKNGATGNALVEIYDLNR
jgi:hypothetical protein